MKLRDLIIERRTNDISSDIAKTIVTKKCKQYIKQPPRNLIYRGIKNILSDFAIVEPSKTVRSLSLNTPGFHALIMDGSNAWKEYPKRSRSIVCATSVHYATQWANGIDGGDTPFVVIPYDGAKWGICPTQDIWDAFRPTLKAGVYTWMNTLNLIVTSIYNEKVNPYDLDHSKIPTSSYNAFIDYVTMAEKKLSSLPSVLKDLNTAFDQFYTLPPGLRDVFFDQKMSFKKHVETMFSPSVNKFKLGGTTSIPKGRECWTDSSCVLIRSSMYELFMKEL